MAYLIDRINQQLAKEGIKPRTDAARAWLRQEVANLNPNRSAMMRDREKLRNRTMIGRMYFYFYDPKHKATLPYYNRFPLVLPVERYADGFLGLNLHYIHPKQRIILLDKLSDFATNSKYDETTRLRLTYATLASATKAFEATPCIKRYLFNHVESRFLEITADKWDIAALLPFEYFVGASKSKVFKDSRTKF
jgi:hypothetical protein